MSHALLLVVGDDVEDQMKRWGHAYNELDGHWDWYVIGGRWDGELVLKDESETNEAFAREVDWDLMDARNGFRAAKRREKAAEYLAEHGKPDPWFVDREPKPWCPYAVMVDGLWRQQGELLMFGEMADDGDPEAFREGFHEFRTSIAPHRKLTIVDYHQ